MEQVMETSNMEWVKQRGKPLQIIRCRDCKHMIGDFDTIWCEKTGRCVNRDGFCSWAVRRS